MNADEFAAALYVYCRRRPFRRFMIEFTSGVQAEVKHPEAIRRRGLFYVFRGTDGGYSVFVPESVARFLDVPTNAPAASS